MKKVLHILFIGLTILLLYIDGLVIWMSAAFLRHIKGLAYLPGSEHAGTQFSRWQESGGNVVIEIRVLGFNAAYLLAILLFIILNRVIKKREDKRAATEHERLISPIQIMFKRVSLSREYIEKHIRKVTPEEREQLISISKSIPPEEPGSGYYIPNDRNFITHSFEKYPDQIYLFKKVEALKPIEEGIDDSDSLFAKILDLDSMNKDLYVFLFDSFGCPGTKLCARRGYAIYDTDKKDIVAYHWTWIS